MRDPPKIISVDDQLLDPPNAWQVVLVTGAAGG